MQYVYHPLWREQRDARKHDRILTLAAALPAARKQVLGFFRVGSEQYAAKHGTFGLATLRREDVNVRADAVRFTFVGKHGIPVDRRIIDPQLAPPIRTLLRRRDTNSELLAWREGRGWVDIKSSEINAYIRRVAGDDYSAKDFRTWHATVLAAVALAVSNETKPSPNQRHRAVVRAVKEVASYLGNTPAVARSSYIDPRVIRNFERGRTIDLACLNEATDEHRLPTHGPVEEETLRLLTARRRRV